MVEARQRLAYGESGAFWNMLELVLRANSPSVVAPVETLLVSLRTKQGCRVMHLSSTDWTTSDFKIYI